MMMFQFKVESRGKSTKRKQKNLITIKKDYSILSYELVCGNELLWCFQKKDI